MVKNFIAVMRVLIKYKKRPPLNLMTIPTVSATNRSCAALNPTSAFEDWFV